MNPSFTVSHESSGALSGNFLKKSGMGAPLAGFFKIPFFSLVLFGFFFVVGHLRQETHAYGGACACLCFF